jgi:signal peptidase II
VLTLVAAAVVVVVVRSSRRLGSRGWALALGLLLGGALGNLTDRLVRAPGVGRGHVVDFLDYGGLFVGNVADIAIVAAAIVVAALGVRGIGLDGVRTPRG